MKCLLLFLILFISISAAAKPHDISITLRPLKNCFVYLDCYYGTGQIVADTAWLNEKSEGHFKGAHTISGGMYFIASAQNKIQLEFLIDSIQRFGIVMDTAKRDSAVFINSPENNLFLEYLFVSRTIAKQTALLNMQLTTAKTTADTASIQKTLKDFGNVLSTYRHTIIQRYPTSLLAELFALGNQPQLPDGTILTNKRDTLAALYYIKSHYWDDIPLNDDRLLYTPFLEPKLDEYLDNYLSPAADSVIPSLDYILSYARTSKEMYPYLLLWLTNRYMSPTHIGQNKVLLHLFQDYFLKGDTILLSDAGKKLLFNRAYALMANEPGDAAPPLNLIDTTGNIVSLYDIKAAYTIVVFWDPSCSHCKEQLPRIDSIYKAKWRTLGMQVYSVNVNNALVKEMMQFVKDKRLSADWHYTYQTDSAAKAILDKGLPNYHQLYDIYETPTIYLLDTSKHILAKGLTIEQFDAVLDAKRNSKE